VKVEEVKHSYVKAKPIPTLPTSFKQESTPRSTTFKVPPYSPPHSYDPPKPVIKCEAPPASQQAIDDFFSQHQNFRYDANKNTTAQWNRLKEENKRLWRGPALRNVKESYYNAMAKAFNDAYGTNANDLWAWQKLCEAVQCDWIPNTVWQCKEVSYVTSPESPLPDTHYLQMIADIHVNIFDLIEADRSQQPVSYDLIFESEEDLADYTRDEELYFPRTNEVAGGLLNYMLRQIINPGASHRHRGYDRGY
jgi:hypothetical protein